MEDEDGWATQVIQVHGDPAFLSAGLASVFSPNTFGAMDCFQFLCAPHPKSRVNLGVWGVMSVGFLAEGRRALPGLHAPDTVNRPGVIGADTAFLYVAPIIRLKWEEAKLGQNLWENGSVGWSAFVQGIKH